MLRVWNGPKIHSIDVIASPSVVQGCEHVGLGARKVKYLAYLAMCTNPLASA